ncbi:hypothetical protein C0Q70_02172 [Pomacea canaliculata]|uniref:Uncharacterized protein n=1 Tax=Pomacea canaliculata TaxID=400727 RepID=A0A2T7Q1K2_POMCA|nr:hypothetical protein C0Q70_02172 [Pomacea canaliculata]
MSAKRRRKKKNNQLMLSRKGEKRSLQDWTMLDAETLFPHLGEQTYRVPPVYFNRQNVVLQDEHNIYGTPTGSTVNGCIAHDGVKSDDNVADTEPSGDSLSDEEAQESADKGYTNGYTLDSCNQTPGKKRKLAVLREVCENGCGEAIGCEVKTGESASACPSAGEPGATRQGLSRVLDTMEYLSRQLQQQHQKPLFIVSSISYDNYLSRLPARSAASFKVPRPQDVAKRGQLDILVLHERAGVILVQSDLWHRHSQVKAVGDNLASWNATPADAEQAIARMVDRAVNQLDRDQKVFNHVLKDLDPIPPFSRVRHLGQVTWEDVKFLCQDDIEACAGECCLLSRVKHIPEFCQEHAAHDDAKLLLTWWRRTFDLDTTRLSVQQQKDGGGQAGDSVRVVGHHGVGGRGRLAEVLPRDDEERVAAAACGAESVAAAGMARSLEGGLLDLQRGCRAPDGRSSCHIPSPQASPPVPLQSCHGGQQRAFLREKEEAFWSAIRSCNFVRSFQDLGIPVQVERDEQSQEIAVGSGEKVVFTDVKVARGLERKVVVFIPLFSDDPFAPLAGDMSACTDNIQPSVQEAANGANHSGSDDVRADSSGQKTHQRTAEEQFSPNTSFVDVMSRDSGDEKVRARQAAFCHAQRDADTLAVIKTDATSKRCSPLPWCIDALVSELDEATRKGLYTAASCCVSQLFVVVPDPCFLSK